MELEFDKEMDAILRKLRSAPRPPAAGTHLDADAVAAFVENSLPAETRRLYTAHVADCDRCRSIVADTARIQAESVDVVATSVATAAAAVRETPVSVPWYSKIFGMPGLAAAFGCLVLVFGGILIYRGLGSGEMTASSANSNRSAPSASEAADEASHLGGPSAALQESSNASMPAANAAPANVPANAITSAANSAANVSSAHSPELKKTSEPTELAKAKQDAENGYAMDGAAAPPPPVAAAPAPMTRPEDKASTADTMAAEKDDARAETQMMRRREMQPVAPKSGPNRSAMQAQGAANTRTVGGRTFTNQGGRWVDTGYSGGAPIVVRRGTDEFNKLPGGLRSIAGQLGGTVVVIYSGKLYEIR